MPLLDTTLAEEVLLRGPFSEQFLLSPTADHMQDGSTGRVGNHDYTTEVLSTSRGAVCRFQNAQQHDFSGEQEEDGMTTTAFFTHPHKDGWILQIGKGVWYLHDVLHIAHRDLKLENVLLEVATGQVKICDFGWCASKIFFVN